MKVDLYVKPLGLEIRLFKVTISSHPTAYNILTISEAKQVWKSIPSLIY